MLLETGDIIMMRGTVFKDNGLIDTRLNGHPAFVLDTIDNMFYYLIMSSKRGYDDKQYYGYVDKYRKKKVHITYINFKFIYKREMEYQIVHDSFCNPDLKDVMRKFIYYQENVLEDEYYNEIKNEIKCY